MRMNRKKNIFQQAYVYMHINAITVYILYIITHLQTKMLKYIKAVWDIINIAV